MNSEDFKSASQVWNTDINLTIETTCTTQRRVNCIWAIGCANDDDLTTALNTVHEGEELSDHTLLDFTLGLLSIRCN